MQAGSRPSNCVDFINSLRLFWRKLIRDPAYRTDSFVDKTGLTHMAKFEINWLEDRSDEGVLAEIRRVAALTLEGRRLTKRTFNSLSRIKAGAVEKRFGSWDFLNGSGQARTVSLVDFWTVGGPEASFSLVVTSSSRRA